MELLILGLVLILLASIAKRNGIVFFFLILYCIAVSGGNYDNPDYISYSNRYDWASYPEQFNILSTLDITFTLLQAFCKSLTLNYEEFRILLATLIYILFGYTIYRYCYYRNVYIAAYIVCYLPLDLIQIRNFFAFCTFLPFLLLLNTPSFKNLSRYLLGLLISISIHFSMSICGIFSFIGIKSRKIKYICLGCSLLIAILLLPWLISIFSTAAAVDRISDYKTPSLIGGLFMCSWVVGNYFIVNCIPSINPKNTKGRDTLSVFLKKNFIKQLNFYLLFLCPLIFMNGSALRIFRFISMINLIFFLNSYYTNRSTKIRKQILTIIVLYLLFFGYQYVYSDIDVITSLLKNNLI